VNRRPSGESRGTRLAAHYDALYAGTGFGDAPRFYRWIARLALPVAPPGDPPRILDIGCGAGGMLRAWAERGVPAVGLDFSARALASAPSGAARIRGDGTALPFAEGSFDLVTNLGNLEHFDDLAAGIREMRRVLSAEGTAWVLLPNLLYSGTVWRVIRGGEGPNHHQPIDRFATREEWAAWLSWGGLSVEKVTPYHKGERWKRLLPSALAWHFLYRCRRSAPGSGPPPPAPLGRRAPEVDAPTDDTPAGR